VLTPRFYDVEPSHRDSDELSVAIGEQGKIMSRPGLSLDPIDAVGGNGNGRAGKCHEPAVARGDWAQVVRGPGLAWRPTQAVGRGKNPALRARNGVGPARGDKQAVAVGKTGRKTAINKTANRMSKRDTRPHLTLSPGASVSGSFTKCLPLARRVVEPLAH